MFGLGPTELIIILIIILVLFGAGRIGKLGGEMGKGIREFRDGLAGKSDDAGETAASPSDTTSPKE